MAKGKKTGGRNFEKGNVPVGNGRPRLPDEIKQIRKLTTAEFIERFNKYLYMDRDEIRALAEKRSVEVIDLCILNSLIRCIKDGDYATLDKMMDRIIERAPLKVLTTGVHEFVSEVGSAKAKLISKLDSIIAAGTAAAGDSEPQ